MSFFIDFAQRPRKLLLRKALFQIHLWAGIAVSIYIVIIALTGAILVFEDELTATTLPQDLNRYDAGQMASIPEVMRRFSIACPGCTASEITTPSPKVPAYQIRATDYAHHEIAFVADPLDGSIRAYPRTWVECVHDLHLYLLLGSAHGAQYNGVGAVILLALAVSGIVIWWPGLKNWTRGLKISLRSNWRRINYDTHSAIGIWTLAVICWWSISGIYFAWWRPFEAAVNTIFPLRGMISPIPPADPPLPGKASLATILASAQQASPRGRLFGLSDPSLHTDVVYAQMDLRAPGDFAHRDIVTISTRTGRALTVWHYGSNQTLGDWIMWSMHPLHFGTIWGQGFKALYFILGVSLAVLAVTGLLMYWNRYLRHRLSS